MPFFASELVTDLPSLISNMMGPVLAGPVVVFLSFASDLATDFGFLRILENSSGKRSTDSGVAVGAVVVVLAARLRESPSKCSAERAAGAAGAGTDSGTAAPPPPRVRVTLMIRLVTQVDSNLLFLNLVK